MSSEETIPGSSEKCETLKATDPAVKNYGDQSDANMKDKLESFDTTEINKERVSQTKDSNEEFHVKGAISEPQLKLDYSPLNKKERFLKIKLPVPRQALADQISGSFESEVSFADGKMFMVL